MILTQTGTVISWGFNGYGNLGQGTTTGTVGLPPAVIKGLTGVESVTTRWARGIAVLDDGRIFNWGTVRPWVSLDGGSGGGSPSPILLSVDGPGGKMRGTTLEPLHKAVPRAAANDPVLYELLALVDALRDGRVRERQIAERELTARLRRLLRG